MNSKLGVMCYKMVTSKQIQVDDLEFPKVSEPVRQVIREANLKSMEGLLGEGWQAKARELARGYWGVK